MSATPLQAHRMRETKLIDDPALVDEPELGNPEQRSPDVSVQDAAGLPLVRARP